MATYTYAGLTIKVGADTKQLASDIKAGATKAGTDAAKGTASSFNSGLSAVGGLAKATGQAVATGLTIATGAAVTFGYESFKTAARVGEMDASLKALAKANNVSYDAMQAAVSAIRKQGIEAGVAQNTVAQFTRSNIDLAEGVKLARVAQDAAVISGRNSTDVLDDLIHGITTQNTQVLRNAGITVNATKAQDEYAKQLGKSRAQLTEAEKSQAVLNAVLQEGGKVAGAYSAAMEEPGKVLRSFPRIVDDIKLSVGQGLVQAFGPLILQLYDMAKALSAALAPGGALAPVVVAIGEAMVTVIEPVTRMVVKWTEWIQNLKPEQVERLVEIIRRFGPVAIAAAAGMAAMVAPSLFKEIPVLGGVFLNLEKPLKALVNPVQMLGGHFGSLGKAAAGMIPGIGGAGGAAASAAPLIGLLTNPITLVVAAIGAMLVASSDFREGVISMGQSLWTGLQPALSAVWEMLKTFGRALWDIIKAVGDALGPALKNLSPLLEQIGKLFGVQMAGGAEGAGSAISGIVPIITGLIKVIGWLLDITTKVLVPIIEVPLKLAVFGAQALQVVNPIKLLGQAIEWLVGIAQKLWHWITGNSPGLIPAFGELASVALGVAGQIGGAVVGAFTKLGGVVTSAHQAMLGAVQQGWAGMKSAALSGISAMSSAVSSGFSSMVSVARSAGSGMVEGLKSGLSAARGLGGWIGSNVTGPVTGFIKSGLGIGSPSRITIEFGHEMVEGLKRGLAAIQGAGSWLNGNVVQPVLGTLKSSLSAAASSPIGQQVIAGLQAGIGGQAGALISQARSIASNVIGTFKSMFQIGSPSRVMMGIGEDIAEGLEIGLASMPGVGVDVPSFGFGGLGGFGGGGLGGGATINVYPQAGQDEREIAAQVSRELAWATAGGIA